MTASPLTATGSRDVPEPPETVWRALAVLEPYCAVCDVSYVLPEVPGDGSAFPTEGTTFVCVPGRLEGEPPGSAPRGEILEWSPPRAVETRLRLTPETWTTRIELAAEGSGGTRVTVTVTREPAGGSRLLDRVQRGAMRRLVQRIVTDELDKLPAHIAQAAK